MQKRTIVRWTGVAALAIILTLPAAAGAQSPYGLAAHQTIPFVTTTTDDLGGGWVTEIFIHNPGTLPVTVKPTYLPMSQNTGAIPCSPVTVAPFGTSQIRLWPWCNTPFGLSFGRLDLSSLSSIQPGEATEPGGRIFEATARVSGNGTIFTVEAFPQGRLSGNRRFADVLGLKNGFDGQHQWHTDCFATALGEPAAVFVRLVDGAGGQVGQFVSGAIVPPNGVEGARFDNIFAKAGAPGNWSNIRAAFSTAIQGGIGGAGVFGFCAVVNDTLGTAAFSIAKYLDSNDDAQSFAISESRSITGRPFGVISEIDPDDMLGETNLHVAYFQHPDRIECGIRFINHPPNLAVFNLGQMRLIDPDGNVVAGGPGAMEFSINLRDKSIHNNGRNGRWIIEVGPDAAVKEGGGLKKGGIITTDYVLTCSTGQGVNRLEIAGHCVMPCAKNGNGNDLRCSFVTPFQVNQPWPNGCY